jgi:hypothetical protein
MITDPHVPSMFDGNRRALLRSLGVLGLTGLAGCQGNGDGEPETTPTPGRPTDTPETASTRTQATTTSGTEVTFDLATDSALGEDATRLTVTGSVEAGTGLQTVLVRVGEHRSELDVGGSASYTVDTSFPVEGGRRYEVSVTAIDETGSEAATTLRSAHVPIHVDPVETDRLVGAHYYPWYETRGHSNWTDRIVSEPVLGEYAGSDPAVVDQHLKWCLEHGIRWLSLSWWGPDTGTDDVIQRVLLPRARFSDVEFSILYETKGRLEGQDYDLDSSIGRGIFLDDFQYLAENFFSADNYLHFDDRPVVFVYLAGNLQGDVAAAMDEVESEIGVRPYLLADVPFGSAPATYPVSEAADAFTAYNPYSPRPDIESVFHAQYERGNRVLELGAAAADTDFVPVVMPGFNDTGLPASIREDNPILSSTPERYERVLDQVNPHLEDARATLVTSFNEWYENTQMEPDEEFGTAYLELTRDRLARGSSAGFSPEGTTFSLEFNQTAVPAEHDSDSEDDRELAFMAEGLSFEAGGETIVSYDIGGDTEPTFLEGVFGASAGDDSSWRWFGGVSARTTLFAAGDLDDVDTAVLTGSAIPFAEIEADVYFDGAQTDHVVLNSPGTSDYELSLTPSGDS